MLHIESVSFSFGDKKILDGLSLSVSPGEKVALTGVSGSGKTTLFRLITGALRQESGTISASAPLTYMRQEDLLLPWRTVLDNLLLLSELGKQREGKDRSRALEMLKKVGLEECADLFPHELSGGMRQRASLARALLQDRPLLLLDEPFGSLDVMIREDLYELLSLQGKTFLLVTHDFRDALALADRVVILSKGVIAAEFRVKEGGSDLPGKIRSALSGRHEAVCS